MFELGLGFDPRFVWWRCSCRRSFWWPVVAVIEKFVLDAGLCPVVAVFGFGLTVVLLIGGGRLSVGARPDLVADGADCFVLR